MYITYNVYMYLNQKPQVKWDGGHFKFLVKNGVKQGVVLSQILFAIHMDGLLLRLTNSGIGCHVGTDILDT